MKQAAATTNMAMVIVASGHDVFEQSADMAMAKIMTALPLSRIARHVR